MQHSKVGPIPGLVFKEPYPAAKRVISGIRGLQERARMTVHKCTAGESNPKLLLLNIEPLTHVSACLQYIHKAIRFTATHSKDISYHGVGLVAWLVNSSRQPPRNSSRCSGDTGLHVDWLLEGSVLVCDLC